MEYLRQYEILIRKAENDFKTAKLVYENIGGFNRLHKGL